MEGLPLKDLSAFLQIRAASSHVHIRALYLQHCEGMTVQSCSIALHHTGAAAGERPPCSRGQAAGQALGKQPAATHRQTEEIQPKSVCRAYFCTGEGVATLDLSSILKGPGVRGVPCTAAAGGGDGCEGGREASLTLCKAPAADAMPQVYMTYTDCGPPSAAAAGACKGHKGSIEASPTVCKALAVHVWHLQNSS